MKASGAAAVVARTETMDATDAEVVARVRAGDPDAYRILVRRYQDPLYRHALRMTGQGDVAADLVQASFVKAYSRIGECEPSSFGGWLFRMVANASKDWLKSRQRRDVSLDDETAPVHLPSGSDPGADLERSELRTMLDRALGRLNEPMREAFVLKHVEGRSYEEIAELLDVSVPALKMRVHRAREVLKAALEEVL